MIRICYGNLSAHPDVDMLYATDTPPYAARIKFILMNIIKPCRPSSYISSQLLRAARPLLESDRSTSPPAQLCSTSQPLPTTQRRTASLLMASCFKSQKTVRLPTESSLSMADLGQPETLRHRTWSRCQIQMVIVSLPRLASQFGYGFAGIGRHERS
jgi:hypothetical protein